MKTPGSPPHRFLITRVALAALLFPAAAVAGPFLTYDVRIVGSQDPHSTFALAGDVITLDLYAVLSGADATHADDGFLRTSGSFVSNGTLLGILRGDAPGGAATLQNNLAPFTESGAQSGFQADVDGDGDLDVGSLAQTGTPVPAPWFVAMGAGQQTQFGLGTGVGTTEFLIGQTTFTVTGGSGSAGRGFGTNVTEGGSSAFIVFAPQIKTDGTPGDQLLDQLTLDGVPIALAGDDPGIAEIGAYILAPTVSPEPSACAMLLCGGAALAGLRRRR